MTRTLLACTQSSVVSCSPFFFFPPVLLQQLEDVYDADAFDTHSELGRPTRQGRRPASRLPPSLQLTPPPPSYCTYQWPSMGQQWHLKAAKQGWLLGLQFPAPEFPPLYLAVTSSGSKGEPRKRNSWLTVPCQPKLPPLYLAVASRGSGQQ